ncbi:hypothetical protein PG990_013690 [Apiospora arundinis]
MLCSKLLYKLTPALLSLALLSVTPAAAAETKKPDIGCNTLANKLKLDFESKCTSVSFDGLQGHPASGLLYDIINQSTLPNDTFYPNDRQVACLFKSTKFVLDITGVNAEAGAKAGPAEFKVGVKGDVNNEVGGTLCAYPKDVSAGGLTLGQVRELGDKLIQTKDCDMCGRITANYQSKNTSSLGYLMFDWRSNADCRHPCIQNTDLKKANATDAKPVPQNEHGNTGHGVLFPSMIWAALGSLVAVLMW